MYYSDLSPCIGNLAERFRLRSWENYDRNLPALRVGWLDIEHPYTRGEVPPGFVQALLEACRHPVARYKGFHRCSFCAVEPVGWTLGKGMSLGSCDIEVVGENAVYFAPALILHYVADHGYLPPQGFIDAVMAEKAPEVEDVERIKITRIRSVEDNPRQDFWRWPVEEKPDKGNRVEYVSLFRGELEALSLYKMHKKAGYPSRYGEIDLGQWIDGNMSPEIGELRATTPHDAFPRLKPAFFVQVVSTRNEWTAHLLRLAEFQWEIKCEKERGNVESLEAQLMALRKEVEELQR